MEPQTTVHFGSHGDDVRIAQTMLKHNRWGVSFYDGAVDGVYGRATQIASLKAHWHLGFPADRVRGTYGPLIHGYLVPKAWAAFSPLPAAYRTRRLARLRQSLPERYNPTQAPIPGYPLSIRGEQIGYPYQGSHYHPWTSDPLHNWESCNAIDVGCPKGTPVLAVREGRIGDRFGPLSSANPVLLGIRLHLETGDNDYYYAHLSTTSCRPGQHVQRGQTLGHSGIANSVAHLHLASQHGDPGLLIGHPTPGYRDLHYP